MPSFPSRLAPLAVAAALLSFGAHPASAAGPAPAPSVAPPRPPPPPPRSAPPLRASVPHPHAYGILVGTNVGGAGQVELRYAEDDARRMAEVLREVGRYGTTDMQVLVRPDSARVLAAVDDVAAKLRAHEARGEQAIFVFYYSGHAKANAFSLGADELPIAKLRERLKQLPSTLTLVLLDACQSGQFARVKGAEPAADFSFNSVSRLTTKGTAVMASSSAQELSQESDALRASYFTHHLIVGLRGAADVDRDGRVSLDEAYRYAYRRTLVSTSQTKVGGQHVTLETDLAGQGDVPVAYPAEARSQLELAATLDGRVLVEHVPSGSVVAEVQKAPGAPLKLAFPPGSYRAIVRRADAPRVVSCPITLSDANVTALDLGTCSAVSLAGLGKGFGDDASDGHASEGGEPPPAVRDRAVDSEPTRGTRLVPPWQIELGIGGLWRREDAFTRRLEEFGYQSKGALPVKLHLGFSKGILPHLSVGAYVHGLAGDRYERTLSDSQDAYSWSTFGLLGFIRASTLPIGDYRPRSRFVELYAQGAIGVSLGDSTLVTGSSRPGTAKEETAESAWGYVLGGHAGVAFATPSPLILFLQGGYDYAPTIANLLGDTHDSGGPSTELGARIRFE